MSEQKLKEELKSCFCKKCRKEIPHDTSDFLECEAVGVENAMERIINKVIPKIVHNREQEIYNWLLLKSAQLGNAKLGGTEYSIAIDDVAKYVRTSSKTPTPKEYTP